MALPLGAGDGHGRKVGRQWISRRYETGFNGFDGQGTHPSTAAQYTAFANTTMLARVSTYITNGKKSGGHAPLIGAWGLAGALLAGRDQESMMPLSCARRVFLCHLRCSGGCPASYMSL